MKRMIKSILLRIRRKWFLSHDERVLCQIGALTVMELHKSRGLRRKIEGTEYGEKLKQLIKY